MVIQGDSLIALYSKSMYINGVAYVELLAITTKMKLPCTEECTTEPLSVVIKQQERSLAFMPCMKITSYKTSRMLCIDAGCWA